VRGDLPYMTVTASVHERRRVAEPEPAARPGGGAPSFAERLGTVRSEIPAVTHVDGSARVQTVDRARNPAFWHLLTAFHERTGCPVLINTSFNRAGEPVVRSPADALRCFLGTDLDLLVIERCVVRREQLQPASPA
jgi:carbamoyltransferase